MGSTITSATAVPEYHALSKLEQQFQRQKLDQEYNVKADGTGIALSQFYGGKVLIPKPTQVVATIKGKRRTAGGRASNNLMQSAMGNLGDHERAVAGRDARKSYEGGHLISDKILGDASYVEENFVPMHTDLNSPDFRNMETKAENGLVDKTSKLPMRKVPITMTVDVTWADDPFSVSCATLIANNIIPPSFIQTDSGATSISFPRRVPARISAKLSYDTTLYPNLEFAEAPVGPVADTRLKGTAMDVDVLPVLDQGSQEPIWGMDSFHADSTTGDHLTGGVQTERFTALQPVPQSIARQPKFTGGTAPVITRTVPRLAPVSKFNKPVRLADADDKSKSAYKEVSRVYTDTFARQLMAAVKRRKTLCVSQGVTFDVAAMKHETAKFKGINQTKFKELLKDPNCM